MKQSFCPLHKFQNCILLDMKKQQSISWQEHFAIARPLLNDYFKREVELDSLNETILEEFFDNYNQERQFNSAMEYKNFWKGIDSVRYLYASFREENDFQPEMIIDYKTDQIWEIFDVLTHYSNDSDFHKHYMNALQLNRLFAFSGCKFFIISASDDKVETLSTLFQKYFDGNLQRIRQRHQRSLMVLKVFEMSLNGEKRF